jgi:hypothetical protein
MGNMGNECACGQLFTADDSVRMKNGEKLPPQPLPAMGSIQI